MFLKIKDIFTILTILCGFSVLYFCDMGRLETASLMILLGTFFDLCDGFYARLTNTGNKFGAEFDCIADLIIFSLAPSILLYFTFRDTNLFLALGIGVMPLLFGCIRLARFNVKRIEYPGFWMGFPRPGTAFVIVTLLNTSLIARDTSWGTYAIVIISAYVSIMNVIIFPYMGHHKRHFSQIHKTAFLFVVLLVIVGIFKGFAWDVLFVLALLYLISPIFISKKDSADLKKFIQEWKSAI